MSALGCTPEECPPPTVERKGYCVRDANAPIEGASCSDDRDCNPKTAAGTCDSPSTCQGTRPSSVCQAGKCTAVMPMPDDAACATNVEASDCGPYRSVFCNGATEQERPQCKADCEPEAERDDCDDDVPCVNYACVSQGDLEDGEGCSEDRECGSAHCQDGVCCSEGDCCKRASNCSAEYRKAATCDAPGQCQGTRTEATCSHYRCGSEDVDDDSACSAAVTARRCPEGESVMCTGARTQAQPPTCPPTLAAPVAGAGAMSPTTAGVGATAPMTPTPAPMMTEPEPSSPPPRPAPRPTPRPAPEPEPARCTDECCEDSDCPPDLPASCLDVANCQGVRTVFHCIAGRCREMAEDDDSGCAGLMDEQDALNKCWPYRYYPCSQAVQQDGIRCVERCIDNNGCWGGICRDGVCSAG
jgi:hypothetical protein